MNPVVKDERAVQRRVIGELRRRHPEYGYWGNLQGRENGNIDETVLVNYLLSKAGLTERQAQVAVAKLRDAARCTGRDGLYNANKAVYEALRWPVSVPTEPGRPAKQVWLVDWKNPKNNFFALAEEVTVPKLANRAETRRPDIVVWVNGIAIAVLELKKATVSVAEGIRQNLRNQGDGEIPHFFATTQLLLAGSESEGVRYGTTLTPENRWLAWKEPCGDPCPPSRWTPSAIRNLLDRQLVQILEPARLLELVHDGIVFDAGVKKLMRPSQYFALLAAKPRIERKESGIVWHSQGSGKSLLMVWLAQWIKENRRDARVVVITDRDELDKQIAAGFAESGESPHRATSGEDLIATLGENREWLVTTLLHKFGAGGGPARTRAGAEPARAGAEPSRGAEQASESGSAPGRVRPGLRATKRSPERYLLDLAEKLPSGFRAKGDIFVFVDECHRTQGGVLNRAMKRIVGEDAMFIGFTGTPLLRAEKASLTSNANFGPFIHTYKFDEAVEDGAVLDLRYEARDVAQNLEDGATFDRLFEAKTRGLSPRAKESLKKRWARMQNIFSSRDRVSRIVTDIVQDMTLRPALREGWGNAMLVCESIYQAYRYWELFQGTELRGHCAVVTSYDGEEPDLSEGAGAENSQAEYKFRVSREMRGERTAEQFEEWAKKEFVEHPATMKLLIVVDKLLTGFDAPPAAYLYIDKKMEDHNLFQAICRVNRRSGDWKDYGRIVDYKQLFEKIRGAISDYTGGSFSGYDPADVKGLLTDQFEEGRKTLDAALERCEALSEPVRPPKDLEAFFDWFCYDQESTPAENQAAELERTARRREDFYQACLSLSRAWSDLSLDMDRAGYSSEESRRIESKAKDFAALREAIMRRCGDFLELRRYDAEMRSLLDDYVSARHATVVSRLDDLSFLDLVRHDKDGRPSGTDPETEKELGGQRGVAEAMVASVRRYLVRKSETNPVEYRLFSERINRLLDDYLAEKEKYREFLSGLEALCADLRAGERAGDERIDSEAKKALFDNLGGDADLALRVYEAVQDSAKPGFRTNSIRRKKVENAIAAALGESGFDRADVYRIVEHQREFDPGSYLSDETWDI